jgi:FHS family Na+ dependent glucose MFS transporter 1
MISLFFFLYVGVEVGFGGWLFTYATTLDITSEATAAYLTSAFWGALTVGRLLAIPLAAAIRPRTILFIDLLLAMLSMGILLLLPNNAVALWIAVIGFGLAIASIFPTILSFAGRRMTITGQITGLFFSGAALGGMTLPWLMGNLLANIAPIAIVWFVLLDLLIASGLMGIIWLKTVESKS